MEQCKIILYITVPYHQVQFSTVMYEYSRPPLLTVVHVSLVQGNLTQDTIGTINSPFMVKGNSQADKGPTPKMLPNISAKFCGFDSSHFLYIFN
jgi:hypothetical protein